MSTISSYMNDKEVKSPLLTSPPVKINNQIQTPDNSSHTVVLIRTPDARFIANSIDNYSCIRTCGILLTIASIIVLIVIIIINHQS